MSRLSAILLLGLVVISFFWFRSCDKINELKKEKVGAESIIGLKNQEIEKWKDNNQRNRARAESAIASAESLNAYIPELEKEIEQKGNKIKSLEGYISSTTSTEGEFNTPLADTVFVTKTDTVFAKTFTYSDDWAKFKGTILENNINVWYNVKDSITFVQYYKKNGWFKKPTLVMEGISHNPNTSITGLENISILPSQKKNFSFGPTVSYGISPEGGFTWNVGVGLQYSLISF